MSKSGSRVKFAVAALIVVVAAAAVQWAWRGHVERQVRTSITALVGDTGARLRDALTLDSSAGPDTVATLDDHVAAVSGHLKVLRAKDAPPERLLADAADDYVLTSMEILRTRAASARYRLQLMDSMRALTAHMRADNRTGAWVDEAIRAKERLEDDFRDFTRTTEAQIRLLETYPPSRARLAGLVDPALLAGDALADRARSQALETGKQLAAEVGRLRRLETHR